MNTMDTIFSRKSIRNFNGESITEAELKEILKAAYAAPVGRGAYESLTLSIITNKDLLDKINTVAANFAKMPDANLFYGAPTLIIVSSKLTGTPADNIAYSNAAGIVQNMALAAVEMGVGACHIWGAIAGLNSDAELVKELNLPEGFTPCCAIALGNTDEKYEVREVQEGRISTAFIK